MDRLCSLDLPVSPGFRPPQRRPSHFSLLRQRKVTKRKATPASRCRCFAAPVPCVARHPSAGANSAIHGLEQSRLSLTDGCATRRGTRRLVIKSSKPQPCVSDSGLAFASNSGASSDFVCSGCRSFSGFTALQSPSWRRATQATSGERRDCSRPWMAEFAPARRRRVAQGTVAALWQRRLGRACPLFGYFLWASRESNSAAAEAVETPATAFNSRLKPSHNSFKAQQPHHESNHRPPPR